jgi:hypothetical protein
MNGSAVPASAVDIYHVHAHFNEESEEYALNILDSTASAVSSAGETVLHKHVWREKNGPHDPWSWEMWVENSTALGAAMLYFMSIPDDIPDDGDGGRYLHLAAHADTDQEYTDHTARLCWVGPPDVLDVNFFSPPDVKQYNGPHERIRSTNCDVVFTMGEAFKRDGVSGVVVFDDDSVYGAQVREKQFTNV